ncbi:MAG TPA: HlyD family secretion protein [Bacteroidales bacterium]|nr:HlyD family secretion protein [Bacteroidales bacterium]
MPENETPKPKKGRKIRAYIALSLVIIAVGIAAGLWYRQYTKYYATDDAYLDADRVSVSSKILGRITNIYAQEGDTVKAGMLLVELDSSDLYAQRIQSMASRDQSVSALHQATAKYELDQKSITVQEINLEKAKEDFDRAKVQYEGQVIPKEQYDHMKKAYEAAQAMLDANKAQLEVSKAQVESAESSIKTATAQIGTIETSLKNTKIFSPSGGRIAKRWLLPGDIAQPGQPVFTITRDSVLWVTAYFEETKIGGIHERQKAEFTIDAFPHVTFFGEVFFIGTNTAAQFSLIPPNNASGNFTKITQRIPVKISILRTDSKDPTVLSRLVSGMSVVVKIYK